MTEIKSAASGGPFDSTSDQRVTNNVMRHNYRPLTDLEKQQMQAVKDKGLDFVELLHAIGGVYTPNGKTLTGEDQRQASRELAVAQTKIEEAVMWAVKHITR